ncbi:MAG TPA: phytoene/squalene synthase family protein [Candidatus Saccharimonadales bacterium]|nr:phytoene/squalene synthase family protein [Candidatus Saccharimonadales bacterium]
MSSQLTHAYAVCRGIARRAARNFYYGFLVLPSAKRNALCAVYAFMRHADDISDDPAAGYEQKRQKLNEWIDAAKAVFDGKPTDDPVLMALADAQSRFKIPAVLFEKLVYGTSLDLEIAAGADGPAVVCRTFEELRRYCYFVASVVGLVCIRIFGYSDAKAELLAEDCGLAFQLTNIIRDVKEDAGLGRIYLPEEDLVRFGVSHEQLSPQALAANPPSGDLRPVLEFEAGRALRYYESAQWLMELVEEDSRAALWVLVEIYSRLLKKIAGRDYDVFTQRVQLSVWEKLVVLSRGFLLKIA